jgi:predicted RNase H-like nuclease (RuvC/YqgF family)
MVKKLLGKLLSKRRPVEMLTVKPANRSTEDLRKIGQTNVKMSNFINKMRRTAKGNKDLIEEIKEQTSKIKREITGEEIKPSKKFDDIEKTVTDLETGEVEKYASGGMVKKGFPKLAKKGWK